MRPLAALLVVSLALATAACQKKEAMPEPTSTEGAAADAATAMANEPAAPPAKSAEEAGASAPH